MRELFVLACVCSFTSLNIILRTDEQHVLLKLLECASCFIAVVLHQENNGSIPKHPKRAYLNCKFVKTSVTVKTMRFNKSRAAIPHAANTRLLVFGGCFVLYSNWSEIWLPSKQMCTVQLAVGQWRRDYCSRYPTIESRQNTRQEHIVRHVVLSSGVVPRRKVPNW